MKKVVIIGGGISGLAALHFLRTRYSNRLEPILFEKEVRLGGTIGTDNINGFVSDWGPNGFLDKVPLTLQMVAELGAEDVMEKAASVSGKRFIYNRGRLHEISPSPFKFIRSPLLSPKGRLRIIAEPFIQSRQTWDEDESVYGFAARRIGKEAAETLIDPMTSGIFGGDARRLSLKACFPIMVEMEKRYGSLIKALIKGRRKSRKSGQKGGSPAGPGGVLTSFKGGLNTLIDIFRARYNDYIRTGHEVEAVDFDKSLFQVSFSEGNTTSGDAVICATPAYTAAKILKTLNPELSNILDSILYASISVVCLGFRREDIGHNLDGFGFLVPRSEGKRILGTIWTSSIFSGRSPEGVVQLRTMIGGATDSKAVSLSDGQLLDIVTAELEPILNIKGKPNYVRIFKYRQGIPQFTLGHPSRMEKMELLLDRFPGLYLTGNAYDGVGLNDCVLRSDKIVSQLEKQFSPG